ncbi:hypothetical protein NLJ89_g4592 [Agrocybe chaxingu]|uniref:Amine oxidase domain-containing protein n=1 Tax=Agrocybe chaxingu TaxID=84603 RepID=A0A9W8K2Z2_9AGAR|nr:hypothetical protein NLJ89_g4592 [Agrocybe chaxingu]
MAPRTVEFTRDDIFKLHGRALVERYLGPPSPDDKKKSQDKTPSPEDRKLKVGIIGAGVGGLYTALMLQSLGIPFEIIERSDRVGGRLWTKKFEQGGRYDYYDVGAMRFPLPEQDPFGNYKSGIMQRVGNLFNYLKMQDKLLPYYFKSNGSPGFQYFNGVRARIGDGADFDAPSLGIADQFIKNGVTAIVDDVVGKFAAGIYEDLKTGGEEGWQDMMAHDAYSTRAYMAFKYIPSPSLDLPEAHFSTRVINWCETFDKSTGWYDRALTETVLEAIAFGEQPEEVRNKVNWRCIDGGSSVLPETMAAFINSHSKPEDGPAIVTKTHVTAIGQRDPNDPHSPMVISAQGREDREYSHVISTLPLPVLRTVDLKDASLDILQSNALRQLQYGPSIKIGILFKEPWWTTGQDKDGLKFNIIGGQSYTDLPIRTVVYPSHGAGTDAPSNTLIASYCWTNDAERLGSLINTGKDTYEKQLKALVLSNLAEVHNVAVEYLEKIFVDIHAWDWNHDPLTMGAFAFFGPGNFEDMYTSLNRPAANGKLHFAGEALSVRHAWVVGALDSAWRAVYSYLSGTDPSKLDEFYKKWQKNAEWNDPVDGRAAEQSPRAKLLERFLRFDHSRNFNAI